MSFFDKVELGPPDAIFLVKQLYDQDPSPDKVDLGIGAYRDDNGNPFVLPVVQAAEQKLLNQDHEYLGIAGSKAFIDETRKFVFGDNCQRIARKEIATVQTLSGTGALRMGMDFLAQIFGKERDILIPDPTWGNHFDIATRAGLSYKKYRYWKQDTRGLEFDGFMEDIANAKDGSILLLHMCAHNPTGVDPSEDQWRAILKLTQKKKFIPFFDAAYQGFASGDCAKDAWSLRLFDEAGLELLVAQSYSKNMGLYGERIGALSVSTSNAKVATAVESQLKRIIRAMYSNPPKHGAAIVALILSDPILKKQWLVELKQMADRIMNMREGLKDALEKNGAQGDWSFVTKQIGMFTYTGLNKTQVQKLQKDYHIYMADTGRISIAGLTPGKLRYVADAIKSVL